MYTYAVPLLCSDDSDEEVDEEGKPLTTDELRARALKGVSPCH